jgi:hypothetical protein
LLSSVMRSYTFRARSPSPKSPRWSTLAHLPASPHRPQEAITFTFLYVPVYVPIRSGRPLHFPASGNSSYTFRQCLAIAGMRSEAAAPFDPRSEAAGSLAKAGARSEAAETLVAHSYTFHIRSIYVPYMFRLVFERICPGAIRS